MAAAATPARQAGNLPADVTSFVGRRSELAEVRRLLSKSRLITLTGVGGVGKTRLAVCAAVTLRRAFDAVWLVDLASLTDPALVAQTVANTVGLHNGSARRPVEALSEFFTTRRTLLILDNCEHLLDACAVLADTLLRAAPGLRILATSRQSLGIAGESILPVLPLPVPESGHPPTAKSLERYDAVNLFADRAAAVAHGFVVDESNRTAVAGLCRRLEGIPLAIELAAVRMRALSVEEIAQRLDDRYRWLTGGSPAQVPRQRTLHALVDWSFQLLPPSERELWARLSVFAGHFDLDAAEFVGADGQVVREQVVDLLNELVDKSLLAREEHDGRVRYRMLETLREFGAEKLTDDAGRGALRRRHRDWYLRLAERAAQDWFGPDQATWSARLRLEQPNIRAALEFCAGEAGEAETGLRMATLLLEPHWLAGSFFNEGRHWLERLLPAVPDHTVTRARALYACGWLAVMQDDRPAAQALLDESQRLADRLHDSQSIAFAAYLRGLTALFGGDVAEAMRLVQDALDRHSANGDLLGTTMSALSLARAMSRRGHAERAAQLYDTALSLTDKHQESWCRRWVLTVLAMEEWENGRLDQARSYARESLLLNRRALGDRQNVASNTEVLGWIAADHGDYQRSARLLGAAETMARRVAVSFLPVVGEKHHNRCLRKVRAALGDMAFDRAIETGRGLSYEGVLGEALGERPPAAEQRPATPSFGTHVPLTPRETEIAKLVARGLSNKDIAATLVIAQRTAEGHVEHILSKLGFTSRTQIAALIAEDDGSDPEPG